MAARLTGAQAVAMTTEAFRAARDYLLAHAEDYETATAGFAYGILKAVRKRYIGKEYEAVAIRAIKGVLANIDDKGELQQVSFGTPVFDTIQGYKDIPLTSMPYGQSLAMLALGEFQRAFI